MNPIGLFIANVAVHFPMPRFADELHEEVWIRSIEDTLRPYDATVLAKAADRIRRTRDPKKDGRGFPVPSEIIAVCDTIQREQHAEAAPLLSHDKRDQSPWAGWRSDLANELVRTPMGQEAAKRGWIGALWDFCRRTARLPQRHEIPDVAQDANAFDEALDVCERGEAGPMNKPLLELGRKIKARRNEMAREVAR